MRRAIRGDDIAGVVAEAEGVMGIDTEDEDEIRAGGA